MCLHCDFSWLAKVRAKEFFKNMNATLSLRPVCRVFLSSCPDQIVSLVEQCCCPVAQSCPTLCNTMDCSMTGLPVHQQLPELAQTHAHWVDNGIQTSHPLSSPSPPPSIFPSIRVFSNESVLCIRWPKYWSFSIRPSNEHSGLISFTIDWFDLLAAQGTLKSLQCHSSKASVL